MFCCPNYLTPRGEVRPSAVVGLQQGKEVAKEEEPPDPRRKSRRGNKDELLNLSRKDIVLQREDIFLKLYSQVTSFLLSDRKCAAVASAVSKWCSGIKNMRRKQTTCDCIQSPTSYAKATHALFLFESKSFIHLHVTLR